MKIKTDETGVIECHLSKPERQAIKSCWEVLEQLGFHARRSLVKNEFRSLADEVGALTTLEVVTFETKAKDEDDA